MPSYVLETVFPTLGVVLSKALYLAPAPAVLSAVRTGSLGSLNPLPNAMMVLSTTSWIFYALSVPNPFIAASNVPGGIASVAYTVCLLPLIPHENKRRPIQLLLIAGTAVALILWCVLIFGGATAAGRSHAFGLYGSLLCVLLFASPLSTVRLVVRTRNAASIYAPLTIAQCVNCATWTFYGLAVGDQWVWGPNATGLSLGLLQVLLKVVYSSAGSKESHSLVGKFSCSDEDNDDNEV